MGYDPVLTKVVEKEDIEETMKGISYEESNISKFYAGKTIFITGSTGFIGKLIVEKILRSCSEIRKIYLLLRPKRETVVADRLKKYFDDAIFETVLRNNPKILLKVKVIEGNLMEPDMGLRPEDRQILMAETDLIIHNAAITNFFSKVNAILKVNVLGVKAVLDLACDCKRLKTFLLVSTAYSQSYMQTLHDKIYPMDVDLKTFQDMIKADEENKNGLSKEAINSIIGHWPNIYTFTKAFGEVLVDEYSKRSDFQCCIFRPSIVMCTWKEPLEGWMKTKGGYAIALLASGLGVLHSVHLANPDAITDIVPADLSVNNMLAIPWYTDAHKKDVKAEAMVFNYGTSVCHPTRVESCIYGVTEYIRENPSSKALWYNSIYIARSFTAFNIFLFLLHIVPCMLVDLVLLLRWKKPFITSMVRTYMDSIMAVMYFPNGDFRIHVENSEKMWRSFNSADKRLFQSDLRTFHWDKYYRLCWESVKKYLLVEPVQATPQTKLKFYRLKMLHYCVVTFITFAVAIFFYRLLYNMFAIF